MKLVLSIDPIKYPLTGIGRYTYELARHLARSPEVVSLRYLRGARLSGELPAQPSGPILPGGVKKRLLQSPLAMTLYQAVAPWMKAFALRGLEDYVFHGPNFYLPPFGGPSVVTIHDLSPYKWAQCHPPERVRYMRKEIELSLRRASRVITDSEYTRREVADFFGWPLDRVHSVSLGCAAEFHPRTEGDLREALATYGLRVRQYALFVGTIEPRKNIGVLLDAYEGLPIAVRKRWPLVLAGYRGWQSEALHARISLAEREGWARYLDFVPHDELPLLMAGARLFVFPSLYEGFGLPVLEAMASGVPVVCSNAASLPEVAGEAAAMCEPQDVDALRALIVRGLEDEAWREGVIAKGLAQARRFSWERCARETVDVYRAAVSQ